MKQLGFGRYLIILILVTFCLFLLIGAFNWFIDPLGIYNTPMIEGLNALKPEMQDYLSISKAYAVKKQKPQAICLGDSTAGAIDPDHPGWSYSPVYNLWLTGANIYEMMRFMQHANAIQPLKEVVLMLDFEHFYATESYSNFKEDYLAVTYDGKKNTGFTIAGYYISDIFATLFSKDALLSSIYAILHQQKESVIIYPNGSYDPEYYFTHRLREGIPRGFGDLAAGDLENDPSDQYPSELTATERASFDCYRKILQLAYQNNIQLHIAIAPFHVSYWEDYVNNGTWPKIELWKRQLVVINEEEALRAGSPLLPLWDFSVYCEFTEEVVPPVNDAETMMRWYWDNGHYKKELADIMLDRIFGYANSVGALYNDFGVLLTSKNIDEHLRNIRINRQHYRDSHQ